MPPSHHTTQTGWKYTKAQPGKNTSNQIKRSSSSAQPGRRAPKGKDGKDKPNFRSQDTIKRLKMYNNGKAIRNAEGKVVGGQVSLVPVLRVEGYVPHYDISGSLTGFAPRTHFLLFVASLLLKPQFMMNDRAGDVKINAGTGRIAPDRRWFGNTRVVGAAELDKFREEMR